MRLSTVTEGVVIPNQIVFQLMNYNQLINCHDTTCQLHLLWICIHHKCFSSQEVLFIRKFGTGFLMDHTGGGDGIREGMAAVLLHYNQQIKEATNFLYMCQFLYIKLVWQQGIILSRDPPLLVENLIQSNQRLHTRKILSNSNSKLTKTQKLPQNLSPKPKPVQSELSPCAREKWFRREATISQQVKFQQTKSAWKIFRCALLPSLLTRDFS